MARRVHIIVAEPSVVVRCGMVALLERAIAINTDIAQVSDVQTLGSARYRFTPDVLIVNPANMGHFSPSELRAQLNNANLKIVALQSSFVDQSLLQSYDGSFSIFDSEESIIKRIDELTKSGEESPSQKELSQREKEIIVCVVKGMTNKQMADSLCLSTHTVIAHRRNIASKLQIHSPSGLTIYAIVNKLVDLADIKDSISQNRDE